MKHQEITEKYVYALQSDLIQESISEDEFDNLLLEMSDSEHWDEENINKFFNETLPFVAEMKQTCSIKLIHELYQMIDFSDNQ